MITDNCLLCGQQLWTTQYDPDCSRIWTYCNNGMNFKDRCFEDSLYHYYCHYKIGYYITNQVDLTFELDTLDIKLPHSNLYLQITNYGTQIVPELEIAITGIDYDSDNKLIERDSYQIIDNEIFFNSFDLLLRADGLKKILAFI